MVCRTLVGNHRGLDEFSHCFPTPEKSQCRCTVNHNVQVRRSNRFKNTSPASSVELPEIPARDQMKNPPLLKQFLKKKANFSIRLLSVLGKDWSPTMSTSNTPKRKMRKVVEGGPNNVTPELLRYEKEPTSTSDKNTDQTKIKPPSLALDHINVSHTIDLDFVEIWESRTARNLFFPDASISVQKQ